MTSTLHFEPHMNSWGLIGYEASLIGLHRMQQRTWPEIETKVWTYDTYDRTSHYHSDERKLPSKNMQGPYKICTSVKLRVTQPAERALQSMYLLITDLEREFATNHQLDVENPHRSQHASYGCHEGGSYPPRQQIHTLFSFPRYSWGQV
jgi:hypothetical protein